MVVVEAGGGNTTVVVGWSLVGAGGGVEDVEGHV